MGMLTKLKIFYGEILYSPKLLGNFFKSISIAWKLAFSGKKVIVLNGVKLNVDKKLISLTIYRSFLDGGYEYGEHHILENTLKKGDRLIEIGAGMGYNSIFAANLIGSENVISFEANPNLIPIIKSNYELNGLTVELRNKFLINGDDIETVDFYISEDFWESNAFYNQDREKVTVQTDNFIKTLDDFKPNTILCDIEGGEISLMNVTFPSYIKKIILDTHPFFEEVGDRANCGLIKSILDQNFELKTSVSHGYVLFFERQ